MRKEAKTNIDVNLASIQGYHQRECSGNYAFQGFRTRKYFTSDRFELLDEYFRRPNGKPLQGYGLEIETECNSIMNERVLAEVFDKIIFAKFPADLFKMQHDGSLGGRTSAECITQVMTQLFIRNNYAAFKAMYDEYFPAFGIGCASGACGMHVNISNGVFGRNVETQKAAIKKLLYVVNHHFNLFCVLTNRDQSRTAYCRRMPEYDNKRNCQTADLNNMPSSHGISCNFSHFPEGRIELRIVGGQSAFGCFRNTMECIFHVVDAVKRLTWEDLDDVVKLFSGCNQYVANRLSTNCLRANVITREQVEAIKATVKREELL